MLNKVFREEQKYLITVMDSERFGRYFEDFLHQDSHNGTNGYTIRSLYFDTLNNGDWHDKQEGLEIRRKLRLRIYHPNDEVAYLEMKQKQGTKQLKRSLSLNREDAILLTKGCYKPLLKMGDSFALECYAVLCSETYRPKTVIEYRRKAFISEGSKTRVTFDTNIRASESCFDIFSDTLPLYPVLDPYLAVLEVKYDGFLLSYIQETINQINKSALSVSKYCLGRSISMNHFLV